MNSAPRLATMTTCGMPSCLVVALALLVACAPAERVLPALAAAPVIADQALPPVTGAIDADGEDDGGVVIGPGLEALARAPRLRFERIEPPAMAHSLVCDLAPIGDRIAAAYAERMIDLDGAQVHLLDATTGAWTLALDWDRGGAPGRSHEVGGQGLARVRVVGDRLWVPDGDAPRRGGFGWSEAGFEDYVFVSQPGGVFPPLGAGDAPPGTTVVLPWAFHVFDVIGYRGARVATGGTADGDDSAPLYPGGLFVGRDDQRLWPPRFRIGHPSREVGVIRATFAHRFAGRLYIGLQSNERRMGWDLAVLTGDPLAADTPPPALIRVTPDGGRLTRRFASGGGRLYWIAGDARRVRAELWTSDDGVRFRQLRLPDGIGVPQDIVVAGGVRWLLATDGLYRAGVDDVFRRVAEAPGGDPFGRWDTFCSAPLAAAGDRLVAGSTRDGAVWRIAP
jgi:hypothetical protein